MSNSIQNSSEDSQGPVFSGEFRHKIEGKNRITIPSAWRFGEEVELFMIRRTLENCIAVMPRCEVMRIKKGADAMAPEDRAEFLHTFGRNLRQVTLDKGGRISIPDEFCQRLGIAGEVMLSGSVDSFNIWNVADFAVTNPENEIQRTKGLRRHGI